MNISPLISIITPVYKAEKYLTACIESILAQSLTDFELILVNDGSPDNSGIICDNYAARDKRIIVIHKTNGGASSARNAGLNIAKGKYIGWVDADDIISNDMFEVLLKVANEFDTDITECQYYEKNGDSLIKSGNDEPLVKGSGDFILHEFFNAKMKPGLCTKLYKRAIWTNIQFPISRIHQDCYVNMRFALMPLKYVRIADAKYYYVIRDNSITTSASAKEIREAIYLYDYTVNLSRLPELSQIAVKYLKEDAINRLLGRYFGVSSKTNLSNQFVYNKIIRNRLGRSLYYYLLFKHIPVKTKISYFLFLFNMKNLQLFIHEKFGKK